jgi:hypothetical protein
MGLIFFVAIALLSCGFLLYVIWQWIRNSERLTTIPPRDDGTHRSHGLVVRSRKVAKLGDDPKVRLLDQPKALSSQSGRSESQFDESEGIIHERIARYLVSRKRD